MLFFCMFWARTDFKVFFFFGNNFFHCNEFWLRILHAKFQAMETMTICAENVLGNEICLVGNANVSFPAVNHKTQAICNSWMMFVFYLTTFVFFHLHFAHTKLAITSAMDARNHNGTELDSQKFITTYQHKMSVNATGVTSAAAAAPSPSTVVVTPLSKQHDTNTELKANNDDDDGMAVDFVNEALATVIPVSTVVSALPSDAVIALATGAANLQTQNPLQRSINNTKTAIVSRNQLSSRIAIKSSSPSASSTANNNTGSQKFHKTDAPTMLNYIFDSHLTNKHRHYDPRYVCRAANARPFQGCVWARVWVWVWVSATNNFMLIARA